MKTTRFLVAAVISLNAILPSAHSTNIVAYATVQVAPGYNLMANPFSTGLSNGANEIMPIIDGEIILTWTGTTFIQTGYDSGFGGWVNFSGQASAPVPKLPPGEGFFFYNPVTYATNFTFAGQLIPSPSVTNCIILYPGYSLLGSPLAMGARQITNFPVSLPAIDGMLVLQWTGTNYLQTGYDLGAGGWVKADDQTPTVAPSYAIGQGFFLFNPSTFPSNWCQYLQ
ncbi:MAG TPA: hypothetical protein VFE51_31520 [Verrucomicrobiae bacterium]|nr:hypothetical protein [Verrucomicrobiae bacterium]